jgi:hypothetical protein
MVPETKGVPLEDMQKRLGLTDGYPAARTRGGAVGVDARDISV